MSDIEDVVPEVRIEGGEEAERALRSLGEVGAFAFERIAEAATKGDFTGLATLVGGEVAGAFTKAAEAVLDFVDSQAHAIETLSNLAEASGTSLSQILGIKDAFASVGISANGFERSMGRLAVTVGNMWSSIEEAARTSAAGQMQSIAGLRQSTISLEKAQNDLNKLIGQPQTHSMNPEQEKIAEAEIKLMKAKAAHAEAEEKVRQGELKDIPKLAESINAVAAGQAEWNKQVNLTETSSQNLTKAVIKAASLDGKEPTAIDVFNKLAELFPKMGDSAEAMNAKMEIVQHTMGAGFRAGQASAVQIVAVLGRGTEEMEKFRKEAENFAEKSGIGVSKKDEETLKEFNAAWSELNAILDQVKAHFAALIASGLTKLFDAMRASIESDNGALHNLISGLGEVVSGIGTIAGVIESGVAAVAKLFDVAPLDVWITALGLVVAFFAPWLAAIGLIVAAFGALGGHIGEVAQALADMATAFENSWVGKMLAGIDQVISRILKFIGLQDEAANKSPSASAASADPNAPLFQVVGQAAGGLIRGPGSGTSDTAGVFALSDGEYVAKSAAVAHYGVDFFHALNNLAVGGFAMGGAVGRVAAPAAPAGRSGPATVVNLRIDGHEFNGLRAPDSVAADLQTYAVHRQTSEAGRSPSWRR